MKFAIGTAQFKHRYGILNNYINLKDKIRIIRTKKKNINFIDAAPSYGNEKIISKYLNKNIKIITKIDKLKSRNQKDVCMEIEKKILSSSTRFKRTIDYILFHNEVDVFWLKKKNVRDKLKELQKNKYFKKIGVSCYNYKNIENYCKIFQFDVFQIPLNILNINETKVKFLKNLKKKYKFKIHARTIYLQGILLEKIDKIPRKLSFLKKKIIEIKKSVAAKNFRIEYFLISVIDNLNIVDCSVIGLKNYNEFFLLTKYKKIKLTKKEIYKYQMKRNKIIDPRYW